jgi:LysR family glycine cleavage system transcriptional activator
MDWDTWLAAQGHAGLKPAASIRFDSYEQMIQAALSGQGVAMGIGRLVSGLIDSGGLVAPFCKTVTGSRSYFIIRSTLTRTRPHVQAFVDWLVQEAKTAIAVEQKEVLSSPPPAARSNGATRRARSAP